MKISSVIVLDVLLASMAAGILAWCYGKLGLSSQDLALTLLVFLVIQLSRQKEVKREG